MHAAFAPPNRAQNLSPVSMSGSEWSGVNNYTSNTPNFTRPNYPLDYSRNDAGTPPDSASFNGPPHHPFGPQGSIESSQRRRPSDSGSNKSSRAASVANSRSSDGTISDQNSKRYKRMEVELQRHYTVLRSFLKGGAPQPPRPNKARDKLLRLSPVQFHELSTDVFDELQRRQASTPLPGGGPPRRDNVPPFLQPRPDFHEKRNQARQKLSSLQTPRFRDLSTDVFCELERRFPHFAIPDSRRDSSRSTSSRGGRQPMPRVHTANNSVASTNGYPPRGMSNPMAGVPQFDNPPMSMPPPSADFGRPTPKQFQSNTITPIKSTMVEDDEDYEEIERRVPPREYRSSGSHGHHSTVTDSRIEHDTPATPATAGKDETRELQEKIDRLQSSLQSKQDEMERLRSELDKRVEEAQELNKSLQQEIDELHAAHANRERELQTQIANATTESGELSTWKDKHTHLQTSHKALQDKYAEQQKITEEVSKQGQTFLREMREMAEGGMGGNLDREETLQLQVNKLEEEVKEWKGRYAHAKTQIRNTRTASLGPNIQPPDAAKVSRNNAFRQANGLIEDIHITQFQMSIDELLQSARTSEPTAVLETVKAVVIAVRNIALDVEDPKAPAIDEEQLKQRTKLQGKVSATANNVITACKNFAAAGGISPVSLLDAAASHLSAAVVELARTVKIRPSHAVGDDQHGLTVNGGHVKQPLEGTPDPINDAGYFSMSQRLRSESAAGSEYSILDSPQANGSVQTSSTHGQPPLPHHINSAQPVTEGTVATGLGIQAGLQLREDDTELQELKIYLENQTDLLVQTIQALVGSIRNEDSMAVVNAHLSGILDVVENVLSAAEGAMEDESWYQTTLRERAADTVRLLTASKDKLMAAGSDPKAQVDGPSSKTFTQRLPPLAFRIARETKDLVSRIESVEAGQRQHGDEEDFS